MGVRRHGGLPAERRPVRGFGGGGMTRVVQNDQLIGDLLMTTPALRAVKKAFPDDNLFYHIPQKDPRFPTSGTHVLLEGNPNLDGVFVGDSFPPLAEGD